MLQRKYLDERCMMPDPGRASTDRCSEHPQECEEKEPSLKKSTVEDSSHGDYHPCPMAELMKERIDGDKESPPLYFPQPEDKLPVKAEGPMGPVGPWASGHLNYQPMDGITGVRPVSDRHSITRKGLVAWRAHNKSFFDQSTEKIEIARRTSAEAKCCKKMVYIETDRNQLENRDRLSERSGVIYRWKSELERAIRDMIEELELLEEERLRVKKSLLVLAMAETIAGDFLQLRTTRLGADLVRDTVEDELVKEIALCSEIRNLLIRTREQIEDQIIELKTVKARMEFDWTDKKDAYTIDAGCVGLTKDSRLILMKPGATRVPSEQSTPEGYDRFTREILEAGEFVHRKSVDLRSTVNVNFTESVQQLRNQCNGVNLALAEKVDLMEQICQQLEKELLKCLHELANVENFLTDLREATKRLDYSMKLVQTRLDDRLQRRNVESCRDAAQAGLIEEVRILAENISKMREKVRETEEAQAGLVKARNDLEREIMVKKRSLYVDRDRGQWLRSFYPSATALSGH